MIKPTVHILSLNGGNINSIINALEKIGAQAQEVRTKSDLESATHLIIPGIGHFDRAMKHLQESNLISTLKLVIREKRIPTLGICLGMHLLAKNSAEGDKDGLNILTDSTVTELKVTNSEHFKIPHNGWNTLTIEKNCSLLEGISEKDEFFFLHKYVWQSADTHEVVATTEYESGFPSVIGNNNCWGVQFHPEKSHEAGLRLLKNFIQL